MHYLFVGDNTNKGETAKTAKDAKKQNQNLSPLRVARRGKKITTKAQRLKGTQRKSISEAFSPQKRKDAEYSVCMSKRCFDSAAGSAIRVTKVNIKI